MSASWSDPLGDLRKILSDGPTDKLRYRKKVLGLQDSVSTVFKTLEFRRLTDFTLSVPATPAEGVFVNNKRVTAVSDDQAASGEFVLSSAPSDGDKLRASYYIQWFTDAELTDFLTIATGFLGFGSDFTQIDISFAPATLKYAAGEGHQKLSSFWAQNISEAFMLEDAPDQKTFNPVKIWQSLADACKKDALQLRDDVYKNRKGQALAPIFGTISGHVRDVKPNR